MHTKVFFYTQRFFFLHTKGFVLHTKGFVLHTKGFVLHTKGDVFFLPHKVLSDFLVIVVITVLIGLIVLYRCAG